MIRYSGRAATYGELWFDEELPQSSDIDIALYRQRRYPLPGSDVTPMLSLVVDLCRAPESIMAGFGKDCRYKINRAEARDALAMEFVTEPHTRLDEFRSFYDAFAAEKGLRPCYEAWMRGACAARQLVLTCATHQGEPLVWHALIVAGKSAWLQYTGSCFRNRDNQYRALVGRANRWLHWQEMLRFSALGLACYDWGGLFADESLPERAGINRFKKEFGGTTVSRYDCITPVTFRGRVWLRLRNAWRERRFFNPGFNSLLQRQMPAGRPR
ncbi:MAG TPA: GNAT family N-acetyltransferase [Burkholderiales bacterium]|nr:GNAT family N-acetyltransferase [Burkholderiales bacterium]